MADEEFDIDIYGDAANDQQDRRSGEDQYHEDDHNRDHGDGYNDYEDGGEAGHDGQKNQEHEPSDGSHAPQQGVKRKDDSDGRVVDADATSALLISELNWWNTDDEIRGWANEAHCEDELVGITFSEHKVNGKSKGQAYLEFTSEHAASATKHLIEAGTSIVQKRLTIIYSSPTANPFKTLPKDAPARAAKDSQARGPGAQQGYNNNQGGGNYGGNNFRGGYHNNRGGYNRGGGMNQGGYNRNFVNPNMNSFNFNNNNNNMGGGFGGNMGGGGGGFGGGFNRGGFNPGFNRGGGMRGGRGGGMNPGMMNMPMGGMPMGAMGGMGGMPMMGGGMPGFQGMGGFNQAFFNGGGGGGVGGGVNQSNDWQQNPHGQKRARGE